MCVCVCVCVCVCEASKKFHQDLRVWWGLPTLDGVIELGVWVWVSGKGREGKGRCIAVSYYFHTVFPLRLPLSHPLVLSISLTHSHEAI